MGQSSVKIGEPILVHWDLQKIPKNWKSLIYLVLSSSIDDDCDVTDQTIEDGKGGAHGHKDFKAIDCPGSVNFTLSSYKSGKSDLIQQMNLAMDVVDPGGEEPPPDGAPAYYKDGAMRVDYFQVFERGQVTLANGTKLSGNYTDYGIVNQGAQIGFRWRISGNYKDAAIYIYQGEEKDNIHTVDLKASMKDDGTGSNADLFAPISYSSDAGDLTYSLHAGDHLPMYVTVHVYFTGETKLPDPSTIGIDPFNFTPPEGKLELEDKDRHFITRGAKIALKVEGGDIPLGEGLLGPGPVATLKGGLELEAEVAFEPENLSDTTWDNGWDGGIQTQIQVKTNYDSWNHSKAEVTMTPFTAKAGSEGLEVSCGMGVKFSHNESKLTEVFAAKLTFLNFNPKEGTEVGAVEVSGGFEGELETKCENPKGDLKAALALNGKLVLQPNWPLIFERAVEEVTADAAVDALGVTLEGISLPLTAVFYEVWSAWSAFQAMAAASECVSKASEFIDNYRETFKEAVIAWSGASCSSGQPGSKEGDEEGHEQGKKLFEKWKETDAYKNWSSSCTKLLQKWHWGQSQIDGKLEEQSKAKFTATLQKMDDSGKLDGLVAQYMPAVANKVHSELFCGYTKQYEGRGDYWSYVIQVFEAFWPPVKPTQSVHAFGVISDDGVDSIRDYGSQDFLVRYQGVDPAAWEAYREFMTLVPSKSVDDYNLVEKTPQPPLTIVTGYGKRIADPADLTADQAFAKIKEAAGK